MHRFAKLTAIAARQARRFRKDETGVTSVEYAMVGAGIAVAIVAGVTALGTSTKGFYELVKSSMK